MSEFMYRSESNRIVWAFDGTNPGLYSTDSSHYSTFLGCFSITSGCYSTIIISGHYSTNSGLFSIKGTRCCS